MKPVIMCSVLAFATVTSFQAAADTLAQWNFNSNPPDTSSSTGTNTPSTGTGSASLVGGIAATFLAGSTADAGSPDNTGWQTSDYGASNTGNKTRGVQFRVSTVGFKEIVLTWDQRNSATSSRYTRVQYSVDGTTFVDGPVITAFNDTQFHSQTANLSAIPGINDNPNFAFRIVTEFQDTATGVGAAAYVAAAPQSTYGSSGTIRYDLLTVSAVSTNENSSPTISSIGSQTIREGELLTDVPFTIGDAETPADELTLTGASSNPTLVLDALIIFGGTGSNRTVSAIPADNQSGTTTITITVTDGGGKTASTSFLLTVLPRNTPPTLSSTFTNYHTLVNVTLPSIPFTIGDLETAPEALDVFVSSSNPTVIPESGAVLGGSGANRTLTITPAANQTGNSVMTITVSDELLSVSRSFHVMVVPSAGVVLLEPFDYPDGPVTTNSSGLWNTHSGTFGQARIAGGVLQLLAAQSEDGNARLIGAPYAAGHGTVLYASFNLNCSVLPNDRADYFAHFWESTLSFRARVYVSTTNSPPGVFRLGIANTASTITNAVTLEQDLSAGVSYLVAVRYNVDSGASTLWVNPNSESAPSVSATDNTSPATINSFAFRESAGIGLLTLDNLKVGLSFLDAVPGAFETRLAIVRTPSGVEISWPAAATDDGYSVQTSTTLGPSADWQPPAGTPVRNGNRDVLAITASAANGFFQLRK